MMKTGLSALFGACVFTNVFLLSVAVSMGDWYMGGLALVSGVLCGYGLWRTLSST